MPFLLFACVPLACQGSNAATLVGQVFARCSEEQLQAAPPAPASHQQQQQEQELQQFGKPGEQATQGRGGARGFGGLGHYGSGCGAANQSEGGTGHRGGREGGQSTIGFGGHSDAGEVASEAPAGQLAEKDVVEDKGGEGCEGHRGCEIASESASGKVGEKAWSQVTKAAPGGVEGSQEQGHGKAPQPQPPTASAVSQRHSAAVGGQESAETASPISIAAVPGCAEAGGVGGQSCGGEAEIQCEGCHRSGTVAGPLEAEGRSSARAGAVEEFRAGLGQEETETSPVGSSLGEGAKGGFGDSGDRGIIGFEFLSRPLASNGSNGGHTRQEVLRQGKEANEMFATGLRSRTGDWDAESEGYQSEGYDTEGYEEQYFPSKGKDNDKGEERAKTEFKEQGSRAPRGAASIMAAGKLDASRTGGGDEGERACEEESASGSDPGEESGPQELSDEEKKSATAGEKVGPGATNTQCKGAGIGPLRVPSDLQEAINVLAGRRSGGACRKGNIDLAAVELMEELEKQEGFEDMDSFLDCQRLWPRQPSG